MRCYCVIPSSKAHWAMWDIYALMLAIAFPFLSNATQLTLGEEKVAKTIVISTARSKPPNLYAE